MAIRTVGILQESVLQAEQIGQRRQNLVDIHGENKAPPGRGWGWSAVNHLSEQKRIANLDLQG